jgi:3-dehydroquinate synthase
MGTTRIKIEFASPQQEENYEILVRDGILDDLPLEEPPFTRGGSFFVVTDSNVVGLYGDKVCDALTQLDKEAELVFFPAGEEHKTIETASHVASELSKLGADRSSVIVALGGGVVGDLAGFVASIYKRGIAYLQFPTTLLAQVDSSIGGKTGVDTSWGKNQLGTFHQPRAVITDPLTLRTLPHQEILNGLAEIIKCAIISDREMFFQLSRTYKIGSRIPKDLIVRTCRIKAEVVSKDVKESNLRTILNFGHTVGHAIEASSDYKLSHGKCVILGMIAESWIGHKLGILQTDDFERQSEYLRRVYKQFAMQTPALNNGTLLRFAMADKKSTSSSIMMSLPSEVGKMHITKEGSYTIPVSRETFEAAIDHLREVLASPE